MKNIVKILALLSLTSTAHAADDYIVRTKIFDGERLVASPAMQVAPNDEAGASVSGSYDLKLSVEPIDKKTANVSTTLIIGSEEISPTMLVEFDKESTSTVNGKSISVIVSKVSS